MAQYHITAKGITLALVTYPNLKFDLREYLFLDLAFEGFTFIVIHIFRHEIR